MVWRNWRNWNEKKKKLEAEETVDWPSTIPEDEGGEKKDIYSGHRYGLYNNLTLSVFGVKYL